MVLTPSVSSVSSVAETPEARIAEGAPSTASSALRNLPYYSRQLGEVRAHLMNNHVNIMNLITQAESANGNFNQVKEMIESLKKETAETISANQLEKNGGIDPTGSRPGPLVRSFAQARLQMTSRHMSNIYFMMFLICEGLSFPVSTHPLLDMAMKHRGTNVFPSRDYFSNELLDVIDGIVPDLQRRMLTNLTSVSGYLDCFTALGNTQYLTIGCQFLFQSAGGAPFEFDGFDFDLIQLHRPSFADQEVKLVGASFDCLVCFGIFSTSFLFFF
jgi:hypothetical protein